MLLVVLADNSLLTSGQKFEYLPVVQTCHLPAFFERRANTSTVTRTGRWKRPHYNYLNTRLQPHDELIAGCLSSAFAGQREAQQLPFAGLLIWYYDRPWW